MFFLNYLSNCDITQGIYLLKREGEKSTHFKWSPMRHKNCHDLASSRNEKRSRVFHAVNSILTFSDTVSSILRNNWDFVNTSSGTLVLNGSRLGDSITGVGDRLFSRSLKPCASSKVEMELDVRRSSKSPSWPRERQNKRRTAAFNLYFAFGRRILTEYKSFFSHPQNLEDSASPEIIRKLQHLKLWAPGAQGWY